MEQQTISRLNLIIQVLKDNRTISISFLSTLLNKTNEQPPPSTILKLLCLIINKLSQPQSLYNKEQELEQLSEVLLAISPMLQSSLPLHYLITRKFADFSQHCRNSKKSEINNLRLKCYGLYPPIWNNFVSVFNPDEGNPHWLFSRYALTQWYILNRDKLNSQTVKVYDFLLSRSTLFDQPQSFTRFWNYLYVLYTQLILEEAWNQGQSQEDRYLTWTRTVISDYEEKLLQFEKEMQGYKLIIFELVVQLLSPLFFHRQGFTPALNTFKKIVMGQQSCLDILAQTFFIKIASLKGNDTLAQELKQEVKASLKTLIPCKQIQLFVPLYFSLEEIKQMILNKQIEYTPLHLTKEQNNELVLVLLKDNRLEGHMLNFLEMQNFLSLFNTNEWENIFFVKKMLSLMNTHQQLFRHKLSLYSEDPEAVSDFDLFLKIWNYYFELSQQITPTQSQLQQFISISKKQFRSKNNIFTSPLSFSSTTYTILMAFYRYYDKLKSQLISEKLGHFKQFKEKRLPNLISILNKQQRTDFLKSWANLLPYLPSFLADLIKSAQPNEEI